MAISCSNGPFNRLSPSMLCIATQELVVSVLKCHIDGERQVEVVRQVLSELPSFDPYSAFHHIDQSNQGYIAQTDLARFMKDCQRPISEFEASLVAGSWSGLGSRLVSYEDFLNAVLPATSARLRQQAANRQDRKTLSFEVIYALCRVIERELDFLVKLEAVKADLKAQRDFSNTALFSELDIDQDQSVSEADVTLFGRRLGVYFPANDLKAVFRRVDKDRDGVLSFREVRTMVESGSSIGPAGRSSPSRSPNRSSSPLKPSRTLDSTAESPYQRSTLRSSATSALRQSMESPEKPSKAKASDSISISKRLSYGQDDSLQSILGVFCTVLQAVEKAKTQMVAAEDFTVKGLCELLGWEDGGEVTVVQLTKAMEYLGLRPDHREIQTLFRRYDKDQDRLLQPKELLSLICPNDSASREALLHRKALSKAALSPSTIELVRKVLKMLVDSEVELNRTRQRLYNRRLSDLHRTFLEGDEDKDGQLSSEEVKHLVGREAGLLMARFDHDRDGKMSFTDFMHEIIPS